MVYLCGFQIFTNLSYSDKRQACAIESAIVTQNKGKHDRILVVVVMTKDVLNVTGNNATRHIYDRYIEPFR